MNPDHLRAAIERIGIEKPSDVTLVMEEVGRMEAEDRLTEKMVDKVARAMWRTDCDLRLQTPTDGGEFGWQMMPERDKMRWRFWAKASLAASGAHNLIHAASTFIREAEEMGWGKTSDKAYPGSFDALKLATEKLR